ncbi:hypothetical protein [Pseudomonas sp. PL-6]
MTTGSLADGAAAVDRRGRGDTKLTRVLEYFASGGSLNRFEAERLGDHCLNSTIAVLSGQYALNFIRQREKVPNRFGTDTPVIRYRLNENEQQRAGQLLAVLKGKGRRAGGVK